MLVVLVERHRGTLGQDHIALLIARRQRLHLLLSRPLLGLILRLLRGLVAVHLDDWHGVIPFLSVVLVVVRQCGRRLRPLWGSSYAET